MMRKTVFVTIFYALVSSFAAAAQEPSALVRFTLIQFESKTEPIDHSAILSNESIERRARLKVKYDSIDWPVNPQFTDSIEQKYGRVQWVSKWLNGVVVKHVGELGPVEEDFVIKSTALGAYKRYEFRQTADISVEFSRKVQSVSHDSAQFLNPINHGYGESYHQLAIHDGHVLHQKGLMGQGVRLAVFDAGFYKANQMKVFQKAFDDNRVKYTADVFQNNPFVYDDDDHGSHVWSTIGANEFNKMIGSAPMADFYLFRTEISSSEQLLEEFLWVKAAEIADSLGVEIISSSLGYTYFDDASVKHHSYDFFDGKTTIVSKGAKIATQKGIIVVNSAGNDGLNDWQKIGVPADVEEVITVGSVDKDGVYSSFSSSGPTADGRIKPDVVSVGYKTLVASTYNTFYSGNGTSYATPIMAGLVACIYQASNKSLTSNEMRKLLIASASGEGDTTIGFGIPFMPLALLISSNEPEQSTNPFQFGVKDGDSLQNKAVLVFRSDGNSLDVKWKKLGGLIAVKTKASQKELRGINGYFKVRTPMNQRNRTVKRTLVVRKCYAVGKPVVQKFRFSIKPF